MTDITPNMNLNLPEVQLTLGPQWASMLNAALELVDSHDHTSGNGVPIAAAALNINADLSFQGNAAVELSRISLDSQLSDPVTIQSVYSKGGDLYYYNGAGDVVPITNGASLAGLPGAITGLGDGGSSGIYYDVTDTLAFYYQNTSQAKLDISTIQLHPFDASGDGSAPNANFIGLAANASLASSYTLTLAASLPTQDLPVSVSSAGAVSYGFAAGSAAAPSAAFAADPDTGMYSIGANQLGLSAGGTLRFSISGDQLLSRGSGTSALPAFSFGSDPDTGIYNDSSNALALVGGGAVTGLATALQFRVSDGDVLLPGLGFISDANLGIYRVSADLMGFAAGSGSPVATLGISGGVQGLRLTNGTAAAPAYTFISDPNTGVYTTEADRLMVSTGGVRRMIVDDTGIFYTQGGSEIGGSGIKWRVFTGTYTSVAPGNTIATFTSPGSLILGVIGYATNGALWSPIDSGQGIVSFNPTGSTNSCTLRNSSGSAQSGSYRVVMYYQ